MNLNIRKQRKSTYLPMYIDEALWNLEDMLYEATESFPEEQKEEKIKEFRRDVRFIKLCVILMNEYEADHLDWDALASNGQLCQRDFELFDKALEKAG